MYTILNLIDRRKLSMRNSWVYFLVVAEEMNISRAAQRCFITQQSMSAHIKSLEEELGVKLFFRKPYLTLTPQGELLLETASKIKEIEAQLHTKLNDFNSIRRQHLKIGISHFRINLIMPQLIPLYISKWPQVDIELIHDNAYDNLASRLSNGQLDLFVGINPIRGDNDIVVSKLHDEKIYIIATDQLIDKYISSEIDVNQLNNNFDITLLKHIPFIANTRKELTFNIYNKYFIQNNIYITPIISCDDARLRISMCNHNIGASIVLELMLSHVHNINLTNPQQNQLRYFPINNIHAPNVLAYHKAQFEKPYVKDFIHLISQIFSMNYQNYTRC